MSSRRLFLLGLVLVAGCRSLLGPGRPNLTPAEIPAYSLQNLKRQRSVAFHYELGRRDPPLAGRFQGIVTRSGDERRTGAWTFGSRTVPVDLVGVGDLEYERADRRWESHARGEESRLMVQVDRALIFGKFQPVPSRGSVLAYRFEPNLGFLDPSYETRLSARLEIDARRLLPRRIEIADSLGELYWRVTFGRYNALRRIPLPFIAETRCEFSADRSLGGCPGGLERILARRLAWFDARARFRARGRTLTAVIDRPLERSVLAALVRPGRAHVLEIRWQPAAVGTAPDGYLRGDPLTPVYVVDTLLGPGAFRAAEVEFDALSRPVVRASLTRAGDARWAGVVAHGTAGRQWAFAVDGFFWSSGLIDSTSASGTIALRDIESYETARLLAALIASRPLAVSLDLVALN